MKMAAYSIPKVQAPVAAKASEVVLIASGDLRLSANQVCWPAQVEVERAVTKAVEAEGWTVRRGHPYRADLKHGFIYNQRMGMDVFTGIDPKAPIVVVEAVWQYSHHILSGLVNHRGPILTVAKRSGQWIKEGKIDHDMSHVHKLEAAKLPEAEKKLGVRLAKVLKNRKAILGVFDE